MPFVDTLNTIRTDILDEDIVKEEMAYRPRVKIEPPEIPENDIEEEESDDIEDCKFKFFIPLFGK